MIKTKFFIFGLLCFLTFCIYGQKTKKTGIGRGEVAGNISPIEAQNIALKNAKENAIKQLGSFFVSETVLLSFSSEGISEQTLRSFMDEIRATHLRLVGQEKMERIVENGKVIFQAEATYEFDEDRFDEEIKEYIKTLQRTEFKEGLKQIDDLFKRLQDPQLDALEYSQLAEQLNVLKGKVKDNYISRRLIEELDNTVESEIKRINRFISILDNHLARGFVQPYFVKIEEANASNIENEYDYDIEIKFSYKTTLNEALKKHYKLLPRIINSSNRSYYKKQLKILITKHKHCSIVDNKDGYPVVLISKKLRPVIEFRISRQNSKKVIKRIDKPIDAFKEDYGSAVIKVNRKVLKYKNYKLTMRKYYGRKINVNSSATNINKTSRYRRLSRLILEGGAKYHGSFSQLNRFYGGYIGYMYRPAKFGIGFGIGYDMDYGFGDQISGILDMRQFLSTKAVTSFFVFQIGTSVPRNKLHEISFTEFRWAPMGALRYGFKLGPVLISGGIQFSDSGFFTETLNTITRVKRIQQFLLIAKFGFEI